MNPEVCFESCCIVISKSFGLDCKRSLLQYEWWASRRSLCRLHILDHFLLPLWPHQRLRSARLLTASLFTTVVLRLWSMEVFTSFLSWQGLYRYLLKQIIYHCSLEQRECVLVWKSSSLNPSHPCIDFLSSSTMTWGVPSGPEKEAMGLADTTKMPLHILRINS